MFIRFGLLNILMNTPAAVFLTAALPFLQAYMHIYKENIVTVGAFCTLVASLELEYPFTAAAYIH